MWNTLHWFVPALEKDGCDIIVWSLLLRWTWWLRRSRMDRRRWLWDLHTETKLKMFLKKRYATRVWIFRCNIYIYTCIYLFRCKYIGMHIIISSYYEIRECKKSLWYQCDLFCSGVWLCKRMPRTSVTERSARGDQNSDPCGIGVQAQDMSGSLDNAGRII